MTKVMRFSFVAFLGIVILFPGCASRKTGKKVNALQAQVGVLTDEMVRLDQSLQDTRAAIQSEQSKLGELKGEVSSSEGRLSSLKEEESVIKGMYRTPSGFELPSGNIQKALKKAGYYQGEIDGKIGAGTRSAIKSFQSDNGLHPDGVVGRKTWNKLKVYLESVK